MNRLSLIKMVVLLTGLPLCPLSAATITISNADANAEGFNDMSSVAAVSGNTATTLGAQRLKVFQAAADSWAQILQSDIPIVVSAKFDPLTCSSTSAVLGAAGPTTGDYNFPNAPLINTLYPIALANALAKTDRNGATAEINATFNSMIDNGCLSGKRWYYGLDGNPPAGQIDLYSVVLHELGHGLGFLSFVNVATGARANNLNDVYMTKLKNRASNKTWGNMTDAERATSARNNSLFWSGAAVSGQAGNYSAGVTGGEIQMHAPAALAIGSSVGHFDASLTPTEIMKASYSGAALNPGLAAYLMRDIGWTVDSTATSSGGTSGSTPTPPATPGNSLPTIAAIAKQTTVENRIKTGIKITVKDTETPAKNLLVTATSSNQALIKNENIKITGTTGLRSMNITPEKDSYGEASITVTVSDGTDTASSSFPMVVTVVNRKPEISLVNNQSFTLGSVIAPIDFVLSDRESAADALSLKASVRTSAKNMLVAAMVTGSGANRSLILTPTGIATGVITVTLTVSDGRLSANRIFTIRLL